MLIYIVHKQSESDSSIFPETVASSGLITHLVTHLMGQHNTVNYTFAMLSTFLETTSTNRSFVLIVFFFYIDHIIVK